MRLDGETAIVTGGGSGLGAETAAVLARAGMRVGVLDINEAAASAVAASVGGMARACDVGDGTSAEEAVAAITSGLGIPRLLVNCAGIGTAGRRSPSLPGLGSRRSLLSSCGISQPIRC